jgi:hypothetical protein
MTVNGNSCPGCDAAKRQIDPQRRDADTEAQFRIAIDGSDASLASDTENAAAIEKRHLDALLTRQEAMLCVILDEADYAARQRFH